MKKTIYFSALVLLLAYTSCKKSSSTVELNDSLASYTSGWDTGSSTQVTRGFYNGSYLIASNAADTLFYSLAPYNSISFPYTVQVDANILLLDTGSGKAASADIIFNFANSSNYDRVEVWSDGYYRVLTKTNGIWTTLVDFTVSSAVLQGNSAVNTIKLVQNSSTMQLSINGTTISNSTYPNGFPITLPASACSAGIGVTTGETYYTPANVSFNNFEIIKN